VVLVADESQKRPTALNSRIAGSVAKLDADAHRRMMAADAIALVRDCYLPQSDASGKSSASIAAVRRR
jgi:hypothetical protein